MPTDFRDGRTFPRRGRDALGEFLWLARVFDKARAKTNHTEEGYIYPCPMDGAVMQRWGISPREFTAAICKNPTDDQILAWLSERVTPHQMQAANSWVLRQRAALNRHDAEEGVPGAVPQKSQWHGVIVGFAVAVLMLMVTWLVRHGLGH